MKKTLTYKFSYWNTDNCFTWYYIRAPYRSIVWGVILVILTISVIAIGIATTGIYDLLKQGMNIDTLYINGGIRFFDKSKADNPELLKGGEQ